jgi:hypothetical protein
MHYDPKTKSCRCPPVYSTTRPIIPGPTY